VGKGAAGDGERAPAVDCAAKVVGIVVEKVLWVTVSVPSFKTPRQRGRRSRTHCHRRPSGFAGSEWRHIYDYHLHGIVPAQGDALPRAVDGKPGGVGDVGQSAGQNDGALTLKVMVSPPSAVGFVNRLPERTAAAVVQVADGKIGGPGQGIRSARPRRSPASRRNFETFLNMANTPQLRLRPGSIQNVVLKLAILLSPHGVMNNSKTDAVDAHTYIGRICRENGLCRVDSPV